MDSASSSLLFPPADGSPAAAAKVEDDGAMTVAAGLAKEAALLFQAGKFLDCLAILGQIMQKKGDDPKVRHNMAIAANFQDGYSDPQRLIEVFENVQKQSEELAHTSVEHLEVVSSDGRKPMTGMLENNNAADNFSTSSVVYSGEFDTSVAVFNIALIWFHLHEYAKSFSYLDTLYQNIGPIDEGTALRICLLLLDVSLLSHNASRSADVISYMEKISVTNQVENGTSALHQSLLVSKSTLLPSNSSILDSSHPDSEPLSVVDLRLKLHLYKVRFLLLTRNLKAAKRELKMAMNLARGQDYPMALYLKSQLEYARRNHGKAIKLLMASSNRTEMGISSIYYNNLGCIYYQLGKHHTSGVFFSKALKNSSLVLKEKPPKLLIASWDKSLLILYNCGVYSLACGRPFHAARCFKKASLVFYNRPLLWLRIAECCLMAQEKGLLKSNSSASDKSCVRVNVTGRGKWRQLALRYGSSSPNGDDLFPADEEQLDLSMIFAWQCLVNALYLLNSFEAKYSRTGLPLGMEESEHTNHKSVSGDFNQVNSNGEAKELKGGTNQNASLQKCVADYEYICTKEIHMIKQATLADLAYVELALGNPLKALTTAKTLLKLPECSRMYVFLGTVYAAEALCLLNRPNEASEYLLLYGSVGNNFELPYSREDCEKWTTEKLVDSEDSNSVTTDKSQVPVFSSPEEARGIFCANYAANFALLGDFELAQRFVTKALSDIPNSPQAILTATYLDLKRGKINEALAKLKRHSAVRFVPSGLKVQNGGS
ncbi:hypothetical protein MIMGU_mgv1a001701mg [Erythranthe guttata]|uniref:CCR4-NOT transcription complex subunit 10 n=1 Tax=Erythranthe guttata TaxID=4155 RepID=A0A022R2X0_ERYGU|nr:hypothetical protein MIMGU_mgv1a001701mg [Erythranthe guttata]